MQVDYFWQLVNGTVSPPVLPTSATGKRRKRENQQRFDEVALAMARMSPDMREFLKVGENSDAIRHAGCPFPVKISIMTNFGQLSEHRGHWFSTQHKSGVELSMSAKILFFLK